MLTTTLIKIVVAILLLLTLGLFSVIGDGELVDPWHNAADVHTPYGKTMADLYGATDIAVLNTDSCGSEGITGYDGSRGMTGCSLIRPPWGGSDE